jgi:hypothetical protein
LKLKNGSPLFVIESVHYYVSFSLAGRTGHIYNCYKRRVLEHERNSVFTDKKDKRHTLNPDVSHHHPNYMRGTQGQSGEDKSCELSGYKQEEENYARNGNIIKDVLQSEKEERINSCDKICNSGSQNMSVRNKGNKEYAEHSSKSLWF